MQFFFIKAREKIKNKPDRIYYITNLKERYYGLGNSFAQENDPEKSY